MEIKCPGNLILVGYSYGCVDIDTLGRGNCSEEVRSNEVVLDAHAHRHTHTHTCTHTHTYTHTHTHTQTREIKSMLTSVVCGHSIF